ncbi:MAG TPA: hypothetical protein VG370_10310 [Chloroflexota bacterium]|jgi:hypothetical protein|nr:hypothetical protein [Chloroflexota bacterium]
MSTTAAPLDPSFLQLVRTALARYGVRPRRLRRLAAQVVRVDADDRRTFALRFRPHSDRVFGNIPLELAWMAALRRDTDLEPPEPVPGLDAAPVLGASFRDVLACLASAAGREGC